MLQDKTELVKSVGTQFAPAN